MTRSQTRTSTRSRSRLSSSSSVAMRTRSRQSSPAAAMTTRSSSRQSTSTALSSQSRFDQGSVESIRMDSGRITGLAIRMVPRSRSETIEEEKAQPKREEKNARSVEYEINHDWVYDQLMQEFPHTKRYLSHTIYNLKRLPIRVRFVVQHYCSHSHQASELTTYVTPSATDYVVGSKIDECTRDDDFPDRDDFPDLFDDIVNWVRSLQPCLSCKMLTARGSCFDCQKEEAFGLKTAENCVICREPGNIIGRLCSECTAAYCVSCWQQYSANGNNPSISCAQCRVKMQPDYSLGIDSDTDDE